MTNKNILADQRTTLVKQALIYGWNVYLRVVRLLDPLIIP